MATIHNTGFIYIWDMAKGDLLQQFDFGPHQDLQIAISSDGKTVTSVDNNETCF
ncbi:hypothetical protein BDV38DRAFT_241816 [Aspergillus pseudotamarii]|uniref:WD40-repeat-containing domain protein n=1 Tax=Aspergillus pseudotamarii TaxID=132259 RepID=A0A5N6T041_ASPPS|nr:uncharacterized protein BDV38DRAFT_241816 [Aspergillus pseudotamarii]KAE8139607.1 hypothetical protein BDV38DRAFT_241816 [Aspergillus pseudotamarii]